MEAILEARKKIVSDFVAQCRTVADSIGLPDGIYACGQYLGVDRAQRGGHGTAAALQVLSKEDSDEAKEITTGLAKYLCHRLDIEASLTEKGEHSRGVISAQDDFNNTIKVSEALHSVKAIKPALYKKDECMEALANSLIEAKNSGGGWGYFLDENKGSEMLPTAFAVRALSAYGASVDDCVEYLVSSMNRYSSESVNSDVSITVFVLYVVLCGDVKLTEAQEKIVDEIYNDVWSKLSGLLDENIEQTIEYLGKGDRNHRYIRVPWQLYMLPVIAKKRPYGPLANMVLFKKIKQLSGAVNSGDGFKYPHSGQYVATRTSAVVYEVLGALSGRSKNVVYRTLAFIGHLREFLGSRAVRGVSFVLGLILTIFVFYTWLNSEDVSFSSVAPSMLASFLVVLISSGKSR